MTQKLIIDSFAGGGGASTGLEKAIGRSPDYAINHCADALAMHEANHPETVHLIEDVWKVSPAKLVGDRKVDVAWFSPDCRHFSKAKGSKPVSNRVRGLAWVAVKWAKQTQPRIIFLENVEEFQDWGPTRDGKPIKSRKGETFRRWVNQLMELGYRVEWRVLNSADFGAATKRERLYLVARCDGEPIEWPEPTHGEGLLPYVGAHTIIDWSLPGKSIFGRKRPLAEASMFRIARGLQRYVMDAGDDAYIIRSGHAGMTMRGQRLDKPLGTICTGNDKALIVPWVVQYYGGMTGKEIALPLNTITQIDHHALAQAHIEEVGTRVDPEKVDAVYAFLMKYYGNGTGQDLQEPLHTITQKERFAIIEVHGKEYQIVDITMRMLQPHELAAAQGFPEDYVLTGTKANQIARIGNSVVPLMAELIAEANV